MATDQEKMDAALEGCYEDLVHLAHINEGVEDLLAGLDVESLSELHRLVNRARAYRQALETLATPNGLARPTGQDARAMAAYARGTLEGTP